MTLSFPLYAQIVLSDGILQYSQDFNTLSSSGSAGGLVTWTDNATVTGWYSYNTRYNAVPPTYYVDDGSFGTNGYGLRSYGSLSGSGLNPNSDRALGLVSGTNGAHLFMMGVRLVNSAGTSITALNVSFRGEQWRQNTVSQKLVFEYRIGNDSLHKGEWNAVPSLDFTGPKIGTAGALDGNLNENGSLLSATVPLSVPADQEIWLRWTKQGTGSNGLAIDSVVVQATLAPVTEPTAQPTNLQFSDVTSSAMTVSFTAASPTAAGYLVLRRTGAPPIGVPTDNTGYSVGNTIGDGSVASVGSSTSFLQSGLLAGTAYLYSVYSFNGSGSTSNYLTTGPLTGSASTANAAAKTFYVDAADGNDSFSGHTSVLAWKTLAKVNATLLVPGDTILFKSGGTWSGQLKPQGSGAIDSPIVIGKYGAGTKPRIDGNGVVGEATVYLYNQQWWEIGDIEITNDAATAGDRRGVLIAAANAGLMSHFRLRNLSIHNVKGIVGQDDAAKRTAGIGFESDDSSLPTRFDDIVIEGCEISVIENTGLYTDNVNIRNDYPRTPDWYARRFTNVRIQNNIIHHISKNAMIIRLFDKGVVEHNVCYETALQTTGNTIYTTSCDSTVFQYNEGYYNRSTGADGSLYDADLRSPNTVWQYSYSHDNAHGLFWSCTVQQDSGIVVRYNVSQNDRGYIFCINYPNTSIACYNNTVYIGPSVSPQIISERNVTAGTRSYSFYNNIIYNASAAASYDFRTSGYTRSISHNVFYGQHPATEPSDPNKLTADPKFVNPGSGGVGINTLLGYQLQPASPAINAGRTVPGNGGKDLWGNSVPGGPAPDRGAHENPGSVRYRDEIFGTHQLQSDIQYGGTTTQSFDFYTGTGDTETERPLVIFIHGGGFKSGDKVSNFGTLMCSGLARRGFAVASINYRLTPTIPDDATHFEAMLKALQDAKAAVRFFRKNASTYRIDPDQILATGSSAGCITALHLAYLDSTEVPGYVTWANVGGSFEGTSGNPGYASNIQGLISNWGAIGDTAWMKPGDAPVYCVHGTDDITVYFEQTPADGPFFFGSKHIAAQANRLGLTSGLRVFSNTGHTLDNNTTKQDSAYRESAQWLYSILRFDPAALPVQLSSFTGTRENGSVRLEWSTSSESGLAVFEVERRREGDDRWIVVGTVPASGTTNVPRRYGFTDREAVLGRLAYRLRMQDADGSNTYSRALEIAEGELPLTSFLHQNFPNPFNPTTSLSFQLGSTSQARLSVFDLYGREIAVLVNDQRPAGTYSATWKASQMSSGVYYGRLEVVPTTEGAPHMIQIRKLMLIR